MKIRRLKAHTENGKEEEIGMMGGAIVEWRSSSPSVVSTNLPLPVASPFETFHFTNTNTNTIQRQKRLQSSGWDEAAAFNPTFSKEWLTQKLRWGGFAQIWGLCSITVPAEVSNKYRLQIKATGTPAQRAVLNCSAAQWAAVLSEQCSRHFRKLFPGFLSPTLHLSSIPSFHRIRCSSFIFKRKTWWWVFN